MRVYESASLSSQKPSYSQMAAAKAGFNLIVRAILCIIAWGSF
jgi:hypothetical protein